MDGQSFKARFESIGTMLPEKVLTSAELISGMKHKIGLDLERLTGIRARRVCGPGESSFSLALDAAKDCLSRSKYKASDLEMIINCSISRSKEDKFIVYEPSIADSVKEGLGAVKARAFDISNACAGMLTGVNILNSFIQNGIIKRGMVVSGEYITPISDSAVKYVRSIASRQLASLTVGDAGAAVIMERADNGHPGLSVTQFATLSKYCKLCIGKPLKKAEGAIMKAKARKIHRVAIDYAPPLIRKALAVNGLGLDQIDHLIPHQTSKRSIMSGVKHLSRNFVQGPKNIVINLAEYGNTASTTVFLALNDWLRDKRIKKGDVVMLLCFASGLVVGVVIFTMDELVDIYGIKG